MSGDSNSNSRQRTALVTGGARRIGRAVSLALARAGYAVVVHANASRSDAETLANEINGRGGRASVVLADLADADAVRGLIPAAAAFGPLSVLVNNAGIFENDEIGALDVAQFDRTMAINLRAPLFLAEAFAAQAQAPAGADASIVNMLDQRVRKPTPRFVSYTLSKSALFTATTTLAQAMAPKVRVNSVAPGPVLPSSRQTADDFARQVSALPLGRGPAPEDVAAAVVYLVSAASITGQTLLVDGGQHLAWRTADNDVTE